MYPYPYQEYESSQALTQRLKDQLHRIRTRNRRGIPSQTQVESHEPSTRNTCAVSHQLVSIYSIQFNVYALTNLMSQGS